MGAPSGTTWGNIITGSKSTRKGRIGIYVSTSNISNTVTRATVEVWYWSMYSLSDTNNTMYANWDTTSATSSQGSKSIKCSVDTGSGWSTTNQVKLATYTKDYTRGTTAQTKYFATKITGIDSHGSSNVTSHYRSFTIPALPSYTVSYNANGGSGAPSSQTKWYGTNLTLSPTKPTRTGYTFQGWATSSTGGVSYSASGTYTANGGATLYAVWKANTFTVTFNANGGINAPASQTKTYGVNLTLTTAVPTRTDYNFLGWGTTASDTTPTYASGGTYTNNGAITLYAVWELAYVRPRINNFWVMRCDENKEFKEDGTLALIHFDWATDRDGAQYRAYFKLATEEDYNAGMLIPLEGTSGTVDAIIQGASGNETFDTEFAYDIQLNVADSNGYTTTKAYLNALYMAIDVTENGRSMSFGEPALEDDGLLKIAFPTVDITPSVALKWHGGKFFGANVLWSGYAVMDETHVATLTEKVSEQRNGLVFVFSRNGDYHYMTFFVPKELVASVNGLNTTIMCCTSLFDYIGQKTVIVYDDRVVGHADNDATGKNAISGITYHNEAFFLRYIYGV